MTTEWGLLQPYEIVKMLVDLIEEDYKVTIMGGTRKSVVIIVEDTDDTEICRTDDGLSLSDAAKQAYESTPYADEPEPTGHA